jgi:Ser/Thr protein kinase RdoA (MazF antagonist)
MTTRASRDDPAGPARPVLGDEPGPLPVTYSILSADALLERIADAYAIGAPVSCQLVRPGSNDTYFVTTEEAGFVARVYGAHWRSLPEISYEIDLLRHLAERGVSVSLPIAGRDGVVARSLPAPEGTRYLVVFTRAPGAPLSWDEEEHCRLAGMSAAALHVASDDFRSPHARFRLDLEYLVDAPVAALRPFLLHRPDDLRHVEGLAGRLRARAAEAIGSGLDWGVCHGDLGNRNIHVAADGTLTVIDFDLAGPGWRAYDFVAAQWLASYEGRAPIWDAFVRGYRERRPLAAADLAAVPVFHGMSRLWTVGLDARNAARWGTLPMSDYYLDTYMRSLREWEDEYGRA